MADIMGHIGNTDHNVDHTTIGIPVQAKMLAGEAELDLYGELGMLMNRVVKLEREMAAMMGKMEDIGREIKEMGDFFFSTEYI